MLARRSPPKPGTSPEPSRLKSASDRPLQAPDPESVALPRTLPWLMSAPSYPLAVVIPAYKRRFLAEALRSIVAQSNQNFRLYVCDDGSPEDLHSICERILPPERLIYRRFEPNLGARHLIQHWNRSVECSSEPWVWLFSDDDVMAPGCVAAFHDALEDGTLSEAVQVVRFNTVEIDEQGIITRLNPPHPSWEGSFEFIYHRLTFQRRSYAPEYIFRRTAFAAHQGFVDLPFALGSDDASWVLFTGTSPICSLEAAKVHWRLSTVNTSLIHGELRVAKLLAFCDFAAWCKAYFQQHPTLVCPAAADIDFSALIYQWCLRHLTSSGVLPRADLRRIAAYAANKLGLSEHRIFHTMLRANLRQKYHQTKAEVLSLARRVHALWSSTRNEDTL